MIAINNINIFTVCPLPDKVENASACSSQTDWIVGEGFEYKVKKISRKCDFQRVYNHTKRGSMKNGIL